MRYQTLKQVEEAIDAMHSNPSYSKTQAAENLEALAEKVDAYLELLESDV